jgi:phosphoglycolate phosphatase-like HAD superfamily hydrolase
MLGDYLFDLQAGRAAGMFTVYIDRDNTRMWQDQADLRLERLDHLLD